MELHKHGRETQFGGTDREVCGARNRLGAFCKRVPIKEGRGRCLLHCGPKAANAYRERQKREFFAGQMSWPEWRKIEERRRVNRLRDRWKKNPWEPGSTIELGDWNAEFERQLINHSIHISDLPPYVLDWLKWKFRRYWLDRPNETKWWVIVEEELPVRLSRVGPRPDGFEADETKERAGITVGEICLPDRHSKRIRPDMPKAPPKVRVRKQFYRGRPKKEIAMSEAEEQELAIFQFQHREVLRPLFDKCRTQRDRLNVLLALRAFVKDPNDRASRERWITIVQTLH